MCSLVPFMCIFHVWAVYVWYADPVQISVMAWWELYLQMADQMPDDGSYQIPVKTKASVHAMYERDAEEWPGCFHSCSPVYFNQVWKKYFPNAKLRTYLRFSKCDTCVRLREIKNDRGRTKKERERAKHTLLDHYDYIKTARALVQQKKNEALMHPKECMYMSTDGTDQLDFGHPHFAEKAKEDKADRLKTKLHVAYVHGIGVWAYDSLVHVRGDPNVTIEVIQRTLKHVDRMQGFLPPTLYLQLDNCWRENKNTYVLAYLSRLVERGVFKRIEVSFLPVRTDHFSMCIFCISEYVLLSM